MKDVETTLTLNTPTYENIESLSILTVVFYFRERATI